jgi:UDP-3-O-[3-hydroxymyristoyl] glucosamine N-acyltransferase
MNASRVDYYTLEEITARFGGELIGDGNIRVGAVGTLERAGPDEITFLANARYRPLLASTQAGAVILAPTERASASVPCIATDNPYAYFARVAQLLHPRRSAPPGIHPAAVVEDSACVASSAHIGPFVYLGRDVVIGEEAEISSGCHIGAGTRIGACSKLYPNVVVYHECQIGSRVILHSGVVIGADGFGIAPEEGRWIKIPQIGRVILGDDVEIGAATTVDRGAIDDTVIEEGVKLDNQIQIGHNVRIGAHSALAGCVGIAGSARIGKHCTIGGAAGISGHLEICDHTVITAFTLVTKSITRPGVYSSGMPSMAHHAWLSNAAQVRNLERLARRVRDLELEVSRLKGEQS